MLGVTALTLGRTLAGRLDAFWVQARHSDQGLESMSGGEKLGRDQFVR
jgi:hypothetical protein